MWVRDKNFDSQLEREGNSLEVERFVGTMIRENLRIVGERERLSLLVTNRSVTLVTVLKSYLIFILIIRYLRFMFNFISLYLFSLWLSKCILLRREYLYRVVNLILVLVCQRRCGKWVALRRSLGGRSVTNLFHLFWRCTSIRFTIQILWSGLHRYLQNHSTQVNIWYY